MVARQYRRDVAHDVAHREIESLAHKYVPELFEDKAPPGVLSGGKLLQLADGLQMPSPRPLVLSALAKETQAIGGGIKFVERGVMPRVSRLMHKLSCCQEAPPPEANVVARSVVAIMYKHRYEGITYGGAQLGQRVLLQGGLFCNLVLDDGAPAELEAMADATTGACPVYALGITYNGAVVAHAVKKLAGVSRRVQGLHLRLRARRSGTQRA